MRTTTGRGAKRSPGRTFGFESPLACLSVLRCDSVPGSSWLGGGAASARTLDDRVELAITRLVGRHRLDTELSFAVTAPPKGRQLEREIRVVGSSERRERLLPEGPRLGHGLEVGQASSIGVQSIVA